MDVERIAFAGESCLAGGDGHRLRRGVAHRGVFCGKGDAVRHIGAPDGDVLCRRADAARHAARAYGDGLARGKDIVGRGCLREQLALAEPDDVVSQQAARIVGDLIGVVVVCVMRFVRCERRYRRGDGERAGGCDGYCGACERARGVRAGFPGVASPCGKARACEHDERERCKKRYGGHDVLLRLRLRDATAAPASRESPFAQRLSPFRQYTCLRMPAGRAG